MRDVEHIYMNVPRWTGRKIEEGTPWLDAAAELESILSQLDSLLGEFGGIGFCSQMGILSSFTDGINAMRDARKYLHEEIVRLVDKPLEECFARAAERLAAIDFDSVIQKGATEIGVCNYEDTGSNNMMFCQKINGFKELMSEEYGIRLDLSGTINKDALKFFDTEKLGKSLIAKENDEENDKDKNLMGQLENIILSLITAGGDTTNLSETVSLVKTYCEIKRKVKAAHEKITNRSIGSNTEVTVNLEPAGYLSYNKTGITQSDTEGYFKIYAQPTLQSEGERHSLQELYDKYDFEKSYCGTLQGFGSNGLLNITAWKKEKEDIEMEVLEKLYGGQYLEFTNNDKDTLMYNGIERYVIALGPALQDPEWDGQIAKLDSSKMAYGTCVDIEIIIDGEKYYIPAIIGDVKAHTYPTGVFQTYISVETGERYTKNTYLNKFSYEELQTSDKVDHNVVEWYAEQEDENGNNRSASLQPYNKTSTIIIYREEVLEYTQKERKENDN